MSSAVRSSPRADPTVALEHAGQPGDIEEILGTIPRCAAGHRRCHAVVSLNRHPDKEEVGSSSLRTRSATSTLDTAATCADLRACAEDRAGQDSARRQRPLPGLAGPAKLGSCKAPPPARSVYAAP